MENVTTATGKNQELAAFGRAVADHDVEWHWVKGHSGHRENELVDEAANVAIDAMQAAK